MFMIYSCMYTIFILFELSTQCFLEMFVSSLPSLGTSKLGNSQMFDVHVFSLNLFNTVVLM